ncbi:MAG TPA: endopeptidase, partial [Acidobacteriota bacterium]|nr:endopeptidase [Acidobacteriota bacterium]
MRARNFSLVFFTLLLIPALAGAFQPKTEPSNLSSREFFLPELYLSSSQVSYQDIAKQLPNKSAWNDFYARNGSDFQVYFDPRSGFPVNVIGHVPLIPGTGVDNRISPEELGRRLGMSVPAITQDVVGKAFLKYVTDNRDAFGIDLAQFGKASVTQVSDYLWTISIPQEVNGIPVRWGRFAGTINHGNLVIVGAENWGNVKISTIPKIGPAEALNRGFAYAGGRTVDDNLWKEPVLEIIPIAPSKFETGAGLSGPVGSGYGHRLAWTFGFQRASEVARWQISVDAKTGQVLEMADKNDYETKQIRGNTYPLTDTEICPSNDRCGTMVNGSPMPYADTGFPSPNNFTNSAGLFDWTSGSVSSHLNGKYVSMTDTCSSINISGTPDIDLGGVNGQHDCTLPAPGGITSAVRSGMFELNKIFEEARGYLPNNQWLNGIPVALISNMNIQQQCNAFYNGSSVNFYRSGGGCRNTGEIAAVFDHEWGHGMDDHDGNGLSNSSEGYADIASMYRLWASCVGYGFFQTLNSGCGQTADGTGFNNNEAQTGASHCDLDCSGVRDSDWAKHADGLPDTVTFTCASCVGGGGPCGRQVHCAATPVRQMAWDFVARDLQTAPFNYDPSTA